MLKNELISVIVPVFNVKKYLNQCIDSILKQTYPNLEVILIDDGSTDGSSLLCDEYAKNNEKIIVVHKSNDGLGKARNTGLNIAKGKYILFVDSDDFIEHNMIEKLYSNLNGADTIFCGHNIYYDDLNIVKKPIKYNQIFSDNDVIKKVLFEMIGALPNEKNDIALPMSVWHGLYSMEIIGKYKIVFPSEREFISEDIIFHIDYLKHSKKVNFINDCLYFYRKTNNNSLTSVYNPLRFEKEVILYREVYRKLSEITESKEGILRLNRTFLGRIRTCMHHLVKNVKNSNLELKKICNHVLVIDILKSYPLNKNPIFLRVFNFLIKHKKINLIKLMINIKYKK